MRTGLKTGMRTGLKKGLDSGIDVVYADLSVTMTTLYLSLATATLTAS